MCLCLHRRRTPPSGLSAWVVTLCALFTHPHSGGMWDCKPSLSCTGSPSKQGGSHVALLTLLCAAGPRGAGRDSCWHATIIAVACILLLQQHIEIRASQVSLLSTIKWSRVQGNIRQQADTVTTGIPTADHEPVVRAHPRELSFCLPDAQLLQRLQRPARSPGKICSLRSQQSSLPLPALAGLLHADA